jgi:hypothetical protein
MKIVDVEESDSWKALYTRTRTSPQTPAGRMNPLMTTFGYASAEDMRR